MISKPMSPKEKKKSKILNQKPIPKYFNIRFRTPGIKRSYALPKREGKMGHNESVIRIVSDFSKAKLKL